MVPNALLTLCIEVAEIGGGKVLALGKVLLLTLPLGTDTIDNFLGVLSNSRVVGIGEFITWIPCSRRDHGWGPPQP